jgi:pimeloyl-ACP methyl ester carboxylesterase
MLKSMLYVFSPERCFHKFLILLFLQVRYDTRGHGRSGKPETEEGFEQARYAEDFQAIVKEYKLNNPIYVGWFV